MKYYKHIITQVLFLLIFNQLIAQSFGNYKKVPFAIGIIPPVSTNGVNAGNCVNQLSFNLISGYSAGLSGLEFAGFSNTERDFVRGAQFAGFGNYSHGEFTGFQFAGFGNFNRGISNGFQFAGFSNFNYDQADGVLAAGFANFTNGKSLAIQLAGFANICDDVEGIQASGFANIVKGNGKVTQLSGFGNVILGDVHGIQAAGFFNYSEKNLLNLQAAGFANVTLGNSEGLQVSGFANVANGDVNGLQISGFVNIAKKLDGLQIGFINYADTVVSGVPIGFLSIVKNGFKEFEISFSEGYNTTVAYKIGVEKFYNIFALGVQYLSDIPRHGFGYGIGTHLISTDKLKTQLELITFHINENEEWTDDYNSLNQLKLSFSKKLNNKISVFGGPTINLLVSTNDINSNLAPYSIYSDSINDADIKSWIGFSAGIKIN